MKFMLLSNWGCPGPGQGMKVGEELSGLFTEVTIAAVPVRARMVPMVIRNALDSTTANRAPDTAAFVDAAVTGTTAEAVLVEVDVIAAKTVSAPRKWERLMPLRASWLLRAVLAR
jgi:hypothetical protein